MRYKTWFMVETLAESNKILKKNSTSFSWYILFIVIHKSGYDEDITKQIVCFTTSWNFTQKIWTWTGGYNLNFSYIKLILTRCPLSSLPLQYRTHIYLSPSLHTFFIIKKNPSAALTYTWTMLTFTDRIILSNRNSDFLSNIGFNTRSNTEPFQLTLVINNRICIWLRCINA